MAFFFFFFLSSFAENNGLLGFPDATLLLPHLVRCRYHHLCHLLRHSSSLPPPRKPRIAPKPTPSSLSLFFLEQYRCSSSSACFRAPPPPLHHTLTISKHHHPPHYHCLATIEQGRQRTNPPLYSVFPFIDAAWSAVVVLPPPRILNHHPHLLRPPHNTVLLHPIDNPRAERDSSASRTLFCPCFCDVAPVYRHRFCSSGSDALQPSHELRRHPQQPSSTIRHLWESRSRGLATKSSPDQHSLPLATTRIPGPIFSKIPCSIHPQIRPPQARRQRPRVLDLRWSVGSQGPCPDLVKP